MDASCAAGNGRCASERRRLAHTHGRHLSCLHLHPVRDPLPAQTCLPGARCPPCRQKNSACGHLDSLWLGNVLQERCLLISPTGQYRHEACRQRGAHPCCRSPVEYLGSTQGVAVQQHLEDGTKAAAQARVAEMKRSMPCHQLPINRCMSPPHASFRARSSPSLAQHNGSAVGALHERDGALWHQRLLPA